jgi:hypothetical protein
MPVEERGAQAAHALGRQEQQGQQLRRRVWQQLRRQRAPGRPLVRARTQHLWHPHYERLLPRLHAPGHKRAAMKGAQSLASDAHEACRRQLPERTSAAHQEPSAQDGARRMRGREQLGHRREQRLCGRQDGLHRARRQKHL